MHENRHVIKGIQHSGAERSSVLHSAWSNRWTRPLGSFTRFDKLRAIHFFVLHLRVVFLLYAVFVCIGPVSYVKNNRTLIPSTHKAHLNYAMSRKSTGVLKIAKSWVSCTYTCDSIRTHTGHTSPFHTTPGHSTYEPHHLHTRVCLFPNIHLIILTHAYTYSLKSMGSCS